MTTNIRKKSLWDEHQFMQVVSEALDAVVDALPPHKRGAFLQDQREAREHTRDLAVRAERVEGPRHVG